MSSGITSALRFREPGERGFLNLTPPVGGSEDEKKQAANNNAKLHDMLLASLQMQHLIVLAGSGCSLAAGGPSMGKLWDEVVRTSPVDVAKAADGVTPDEASPEVAGVTPDVVSQEVVGATPDAAWMKIAGLVGHDIKNANIEEFLSRIEGYLDLWPNKDAEAEAFLIESKRRILAKCSRFAQDDPLDAHQRFLHRLSRRRVRDQRLRVFTTNYDLCFERAAGALGCVAVDGFSFAVPRRYDPRFFGYDIVRRPQHGDDMVNYLEGVFLLYKLHGSVNWARSADGTITEQAEPAPEEACLIYPAKGKYQRSFTQPHLESMAQYLAVVREPNTCVLVVGFGFNDDHLSEPLLAAAKSNPHMRLLIVDPAGEQKVAGDNRYWKQLGELARGGSDIWFIEAGFNEFAKMIPDLKSLTPADKLMQVVQRAARAP